MEIEVEKIMIRNGTLNNMYFKSFIVESITRICKNTYELSCYLQNLHIKFNFHYNFDNKVYIYE